MNPRDIDNKDVDSRNLLDTVNEILYWNVTKDTTIKISSKALKQLVSVLIESKRF